MQPERLGRQPAPQRQLGSPRAAGNQPERRLRIALLTHSINPRGGVVHCLELGEALTALGHEVTLHAPAAEGARLFRDSRCEIRLIAEHGRHSTLRSLVQARIAAFTDWFAAPGRAGFDLYHAHDGIGANALLALRQRGLLPAYLRTVHHLESSFGDPVVDALELRSIQRADRLLCVSPSWQQALRERLGLAAGLVGNGVDLARFQPRPDAGDAALKARLGLGDAPVFLAVGGIEARKNTLGTLRAFARLRRTLGAAQLVIAGGASLLDHGAYRRAFDAALAAEGLAQGEHGGAVILAGVLADAEMPALYRLADALVFPSLVEGFGLAILEAMASGTPAVVSRIAPFTDFLGAEDCLWADPQDAESIASAMCRALMPGTRERVIAAGRATAARHDWPACARAHLAAYGELLAATRFPETPHA